MPFKDPEKRREYHRRYYSTPERKAIARQYRTANKEKITARKREHYLANRESVLASHRRWRQNNPEALRIYFQRLRRYNPERDGQYRLRKQEAEAGRRRPDACEVCGGTDGGIQFDHCHQRGIFRGWLCSNCNIILGFAKDNPDVLRKLIVYLERTKGLIAPQFTLPGI